MEEPLPGAPCQRLLQSLAREPQPDGFSSGGRGGNPRSSGLPPEPSWETLPQPPALLSHKPADASQYFKRLHAAGRLPTWPLGTCAPGELSAQTGRDAAPAAAPSAQPFPRPQRFRGARTPLHGSPWVLQLACRARPAQRQPGQPSPPPQSRPCKSSRGWSDGQPCCVPFPGSVQTQRMASLLGGKAGVGSPVPTGVSPCLCLRGGQRERTSHSAFLGT